MQRVVPWILVLGLLHLAVPSAHAFGQTQDAAGEEFFEAHIRPILSAHCFECHGPQTQQAGLRLDGRETLLRGGDSGPAVVPGKPDESLLLAAVSYGGDTEMPPAGKLDEDSIARLREWVARGAPMPDQPLSIKGPPTPAEAANSHWSFRPIQEPSPPTVENAAWVSNEVDAFVLAELEKQGVQPSPPADRRTLVRRLYLDLIGLPPTAEEIDAFAADPRPDAVERLVDRLLASPHYGERWGRHWLDVARYADTKGYVFTQERRYPFSYTYRDWVVRSFNEDKPFNEFLMAQLAADHLGAADDLAALGFLTVGRRFLNNPHDIIDDRIDVVTRGMLGLTVTCARCHDHKYDPIPTADYYSLYGVFASCHEPGELPELPHDATRPEYQDYLAQLAVRDQEVEKYLGATHTEMVEIVRSDPAALLRAMVDLGMEPNHPKRDEMATALKVTPRVVTFAMEQWKAQLNEAGGEGPLALWRELAAVPADLPAEECRTRTNALLDAWSSTNAASFPELNTRLAEARPVNLAEFAALLGPLMVEARKRAGAEAVPDANATAPANAPGEWEVYRLLLEGPKGLATIPRAGIEGFLDRPRADKLLGLRNERQKVIIEHPGAPPRAMIVADNAAPAEPRIFQRGNPGRPGDPVPRQFLEVLAGPERQPFAQGSGRLELARQIADPNNPLTARVFANRVWHHHFGRGLVNSNSDFGLRSDPPSHPELLDWLAYRFLRGGWSVKQLHRSIVLSATYQQASAIRPELVERDPENRLLARQNKRRLELEPLRDSMLAVSGLLDSTLGGRSVPIFEPPFPKRRTLYGYVDRQNLEPAYRTFDFASPDASSPHRPATTVPQQSLFLMNSPFVEECSIHLANACAGTPEERVRELYRRTLGRSPDAEEVSLALTYLDRQGQRSDGPAGLAWSYGTGTLDEEQQRLTRFEPLPHFREGRWQLDPAFPAPDGNFASLTSKGGHPGPGADMAVVRRWTAPRTMTIEVAGQLHHPEKQGDGIRAHLLTTSGSRGRWHVHGKRIAMVPIRLQVEVGQTLDFVVAAGKNQSFDSYEWEVTLREVAAVDDLLAGQWSSREDFGEVPIPADPWARLAQVLLMTNEFAFVD